MARTFWKGSLSFGLVEIPVTLRKAVTEDELSFSLLDRRDFSPVGYKHYNKSTGREVEWAEIVRGYEYEPDEYVVLTDEELKAANVEATRAIEIVEFVDRDEIPPIYFDTPYFVEPQNKNSRSYALLRAALERTDKVGIARVVLRTRQRMAALLVRDATLMLDLLRYPHELRTPSDLSVPAKGARGAKVETRELEMAERLVKGMSGTWEPERFKDEYRDDVMALVERKVKAGQTHEVLEIEGEKRPRTRGEVVDLMDALKQSLNARISREKGGASEARHASRNGHAPRTRARAASRVAEEEKPAVRQRVRAKAARGSQRGHRRSA